MRFCVSCRQDNLILKEVEEIKVEYKDINFIHNYIEQEEKPHIIILRLLNNTEINWSLLKMFNDKLSGNFILALDDLKDASTAKEYNLKFYWNYPITTYYELNHVINMGACQVILGLPLCFNIPYIKSKNIKIRLIPNYTFRDYLMDDGVKGGWIRPEDLVLYEDIAESCEFKAKSIQREKAIYNIYKLGSWPDDLQFIIDGLEAEFYNQHLEQGFTKARMECKLICGKKP